MNKLMTAVCTATLLSIALPVAAQETPHAGYRETGVVRDWVGIYSPDRGIEDPQSSCAMYSRPIASTAFKDEAPVEVLRGELAAFVSWNGASATDTTGEVSFMIGQPVTQGVDDAHVLSVNGETVASLIGVGDRLYVKPEDDAKVIAAIRKGREMVVSARGIEGVLTKDTYSLFGVQGVTDIQKRDCK